MKNEFASMVLELPLYTMLLWIFDNFSLNIPHKMNFTTFKIKRYSKNALNRMANVLKGRQ